MSDWRKYNLTFEQYQGMIALTDNHCYICGAAPKTKSLCIDHDHVSGQVRGLLCYRCNNKLIGRHSDPELFIKAADYLVKSQTSNLPKVPPKKYKRYKYPKFKKRK